MALKVPKDKYSVTTFPKRMQGKTTTFVSRKKAEEFAKRKKKQGTKISFSTAVRTPSGGLTDRKLKFKY